MEASESPQLTLLTDRYNHHELPLSDKRLDERKADAQARSEAMSVLATGAGCRMARLTAWFGQIMEKPCGICDHCLQNKKQGGGESINLAHVLREIKPAGILLKDLQLRFSPFGTIALADALRALAEQNKIVIMDERVEPL